MKRLFILLALITLAVSCKTKKMAFGAPVIAKEMSAKKVARKHLAANFHERSLEANLKIAYHDSKRSQSVRVKMRILKDQVIWLNATYAGFVVARAKITPTRVSYYEKLNKTYFDGDFSLLKNVLGSDVGFAQLQNLLLGQSIANLTEHNYESSVDQNAHLLTPKNKADLFDVLLWVNPGHFKLDKQELKNTEKNQLLEIDYSHYALIDGEVFPKDILIKGTQGDQFTTVAIEFKSIVFNKDISTPFHIPNGYKPIVFNE